MYGEGISRISEILDMGVKYDLIEKAGSFYSYNSERMGQGEANARQWLKDHEDVQKELLDKIMGRASGIAEEMTTGPSDEESFLKIQKNNKITQSDSWLGCLSDF